MRRLACLTDLAAAWVARPYAVGPAGWRNAKSIGRIGRASVAFGPRPDASLRRASLPTLRAAEGEDVCGFSRESLQQGL